jgi:hypothetical protein
MSDIRISERGEREVPVPQGHGFAESAYSQKLSEAFLFRQEG